MSKDRLDKLRERCLRAIKRGITTTAKLYPELDVDTATLQTVIRSLLKDGLIRRVKHGEYALTPQGEEHLAKTMLTVELPFGDKAVQDFLKQFPEPYRGVMRLTISSYVAKHSRLFDEEQFDGAYPGTILPGDPGMGKTPVGEAICRLLGLKFSEHKVDVQSITKGQFAGRPVQRKGGVWDWEASYYFGLGYLVIDEPQNITDPAMSNYLRFVLHGDKTYKKEGKSYYNRIVPFVTLNLLGKEAQTVMDKIVNVKGLEEATIKRNNVLFTNPLKGYLGDPYIFFGEVMKDIPKIDLSCSVIKFYLEPQEKKLLVKLIHRAMKEEFEYSCCDKRGLEVMVLGHYVVTGNEDIIGSIYQIARDRLACLETLNLTQEDWRDDLDTERLEHQGTRDPKKEKEIREALKREALERKEKDKEKEEEEEKERDEAFTLNTKYSKGLTDFLTLRDSMTKRSQAPFRKGIKEEYDRDWVKKPWDEEKLEKLKTRTEKLQKEVVTPVLELQAQIKRKRQQEKDDRKTIKDREREERDTAIGEMRNLRRELNQKELMNEVQLELKDIRERMARWKVRHPKRILIGGGEGQAKNKMRAIQKLRAKGAKLSTWLGVRIKRAEKSYPLSELQNDLGTAIRQAKPWLDQYEEDSKDFSEIVVDGIVVKGVEVMEGIKGLFKRRGKKEPPDEPPEYNGRSFDEF